MGFENGRNERFASKDSSPICSLKVVLFLLNVLLSFWRIVKPLFCGLVTLILNEEYFYNIEVYLLALNFNLLRIHSV